MEVDGLYCFVLFYVYEISKKLKDFKVGDVLKFSKGYCVLVDVIVLKCFLNEVVVY